MKAININIYAPINFTAPCIIFSGGFFHYEGDWARELKTFLGPVKSHEPLGEFDLEVFDYRFNDSPIELFLKYSQ